MWVHTASKCVVFGLKIKWHGGHHEQALVPFIHSTYLFQLGLLANIISVSIACHTPYSLRLTSLFPPVFCEWSIFLSYTKLLLRSGCRGYYLPSGGDIGLSYVPKPLGYRYGDTHVVWVNEYRVVAERLYFTYEIRWGAASLWGTDQLHAKYD